MSFETRQAGEKQRELVTAREAARPRKSIVFGPAKDAPDSRMPNPFTLDGADAPPPVPPADFKFGGASPPALVQLSEPEGDSSDDDEGKELPEAVFRRLMGLKTLHEQRDKIKYAYTEERIALEKKYALQLDDLYAQRADIVSGKVDVVEDGAPDPAVNEPVIFGVPNFWLSTMGHHELVSELIVEARPPSVRALGAR